MARHSLCLRLAAISFLAAAAHAQYVQQSKLTPGSALGSPAAGTSVAASADGNTVIVGGPDDNQGAGAAWVYTRAGDQWTLQAKLVGTGSVGVAGQGSSVAISADGNTAVVGGTNDNTGTGAIWFFTRSNGVWTQQGPRLWGTVLSGLSHQGGSVAISADGNTVIEGGDLDNNNMGAAWVFTRSNGVWSILPSKLVGTGGLGAPHQGASVALSADGTTALVGGPEDTSGTGAAWVFTLNGGTWVQQARLLGVGVPINAGFGTSVALSSDGNTALVGAPRDTSNTGSLWVFTRSNGQWTQQGPKLTGSAAAPSRFLGQSVAFSGDGNTALAGGPGGTDSIFGHAPAIGATWVFRRSNGAWSQQQGPLAGTGVVGNDALQGTAVALSSDGSTAVIGGPIDNSRLGAAWVFVRPASVSPPSITVQPASQNIFSGQSATLTVVASGPGALSYQWYQGAKGDTSTPVGSNSATFTTPVLNATTGYWVRVSNQYGSIDSETAIVSVPANGPIITAVMNAASGSTTIAPNTWVAIRGTNLAPAGDIRIWQAADFTNNQMPAQLDGVSATVNGRRAYIYYISPTQVNILTPPDSIQGLVQVQLTNAGVPSAPFLAQAQAISPSFFLSGGSPYVAAEHANGSYLGPTTLYPGFTTPAKPGEIIVLFGNGFGPTSVPVTAGSPIQSGTLSPVPDIRIGGFPAAVQFAGLVAPGEYQFNVVVPENVPDGDNLLTATSNGVPTQAGVLLTVQR
jgi:uncharacterized protein (TIGR03437 family)